MWGSGGTSVERKGRPVATPKRSDPNQRGAYKPPAAMIQRWLFVRPINASTLSEVCVRGVQEFKGTEPDMWPGTQGFGARRSFEACLVKSPSVNSASVRRLSQQSRRAAIGSIRVARRAGI